MAEGLDVEFRLGDAEDLPVAGGSFDAVLSVFGVMFAPDHGAAVADAESVRRTCTWRFTSPEEFVWFFRRWYGPALKAFEALDEDGRAALAHDLAQLARHWGRDHGGGIAIPATYLETILTLR